MFYCLSLTVFLKGMHIIRGLSCFIVYLLPCISKGMHIIGGLSCFIEAIDIEFEVMAVTPQTPKCHHNRGAAEVVVTFGSLWCHSHDRKRGINFYSIMVPQN